MFLKWQHWIELIVYCPHNYGNLLFHQHYKISVQNLYKHYFIYIYKNIIRWYYNGICYIHVKFWRAVYYKLARVIWLIPWDIVDVFGLNNAFKACEVNYNLNQKSDILVWCISGSGGVILMVKSLAEKNLGIGVCRWCISWLFLYFGHRNFNMRMSSFWMMFLGPLFMLLWEIWVHFFSEESLADSISCSVEKWSYQIRWRYELPQNVNTSGELKIRLFGEL